MDALPPTSPKNIPTVFIIFGATGDLMAKKITPALFQLYINKKLPSMFKIIGFSRRSLTQDDFKVHVRQILKANRKSEESQIESFLNYFMYHKGEFDTLDSYSTLAEYLGQVDGEWKACSNKLFYLAVPPKNYKTIFQHLKSSDLTLPCGPDEGWTRVIVEKPFGKNAETAQELDTLLGKLFKEEQIYRIDHYLGKDMLQNILTFRFNNDLFEREWDGRHIEKIEIKFLESMGTEGREVFYEGVGALRDVGQNHMLQMLAFITMDQPDSFTATDVRQQRMKALQKLKPLSEDEVLSKTFRGQYVGYTAGEGVTTSSKTETYFKVIAELTTERWKGVPIILEAGKKLEKRKEVIVTFRHKSSCLCTGDTHYKNRLLFTLEPKEGITIEFWSKKPGLTYAMEKQKLSFLFRDQRKKAQYIEEYEKLLLDCILGNQISFISTEEVQAMWKFIDPIATSWEKNKVKLVKYKPKLKRILLESMKIEA